MESLSACMAKILRAVKIDQVRVTPNFDRDLCHVYGFGPLAWRLPDLLLRIFLRLCAARTKQGPF